MKAKGKSVNGARRRTKSRSVPLDGCERLSQPGSRSASRRPSPESAARGRAPFVAVGRHDRAVEKVGDGRPEAVMAGRAMAPLGTVGMSVGRDRGPAPPMPIPIATFNI